MSQWSNKYNAFNSLKALVHTQYWKQIVQKGTIPPPKMVSIDPNGKCDFDCPHCNARRSIKPPSVNNGYTTYHMNVPMINSVIRLLKFWNTRAVCIGGGGQALLNPNTNYLIQQLSLGGVSQIGIVTNGSQLHTIHKENVNRCKWIGISVDAATPQTISKMKGIKPNFFQKIIKNISRITNNDTQISYKYLLHPNNCSQVYQAIKLAKQIGCDLIHIRPGAQPWFQIGKKSFDFTQQMITSVVQQVQQGRKDFQSDKFRIYGITHKFTNKWNIKKSFNRCHALFTTCYISPKGQIGLCCDRRGDDQLILGNLDNIRQKWGSEQHFKIHQKIKVQKCPRCTYSHVNQIFQNVIIEDKMFYNMF